MSNGIGRIPIRKTKTKKTKDDLKKHPFQILKKSDYLTTV